MQSKATSVEQYLSELPEDRRAAISAVRRTILDNLDPDFEEGMQYGMIGFYVPHRIYPAGYHCNPEQPLPFACLASQKNHMALYLMTIYGDPKQEQAFRDDWAKTGRRLDMGKSCIRFRKLEDLALDVIGRAIRRVKAAAYIASVEAAIKNRKSGSSTKSAAPARQTGKTNSQAAAKGSATSGKTARAKPAAAAARKSTGKPGTKKKTPKKKS